MPRAWLYRSLGIIMGILLPLFAFSHRSGCHTYHSCPSDSGTYVCGDKGYCGSCPDNQYCAGGAARSAGSGPAGETAPAPSPESVPAILPPSAEAQESRVLDIPILSSPPPASLPSAPEPAIPSAQGGTTSGGMATPLPPPPSAVIISPPPAPPPASLMPAVNKKSAPSVGVPAQPTQEVKQEPEQKTKETTQSAFQSTAAVSTSAPTVFFFAASIALGVFAAIGFLFFRL